jgi:hypothetical protein
MAPKGPYTDPISAFGSSASLSIRVHTDLTDQTSPYNLHTAGRSPGDAGEGTSNCAKIETGTQRKLLFY